LSQSLARLAAGVEHATRVVGETLAELSGELVRLRGQIAASSAAAAQHEEALVRWTKILTVATIVYAALTAGLLAVGVLALLRGQLTR
jgi:hypothetical protein